jgi:hypothetical protein
VARKTSGFQYGPLTVVVQSEGHDKLWHFRIYDTLGESFEGTVNPRRPNDSMAAKEVIWALTYFLQDEKFEDSDDVLAFPGMTVADLRRGAKAFGNQLLEAEQVIQDSQEDREKSMDGYRQQVECRYKCPGEDMMTFPVWPRKGETSTETCRRFLKERRKLSDQQIDLCEKVEIRYID